MAASCKDWVERITDYLEGALPAGERAHLESHLQKCKPCQSYLEQMRQTIRCVGALREEPSGVPAETKAKLLQLFRASQPAVGKSRRIRLGILDQYAAPGDHIGYFWETEQEFEEASAFSPPGSTTATPVHLRPRGGQRQSAGAAAERDLRWTSCGIASACKC
jgi:anti-sigma factor RsiW